MLILNETHFVLHPRLSMNYILLCTDTQTKKYNVIRTYSCFFSINKFVSALKVEDWRQNSLPSDLQTNYKRHPA